MIQDQNKILLTSAGLKKLKEEYQKLVKIKRPVVAERLAEARREGDLSENSGYTQSKEELAFIDGRINELKEVIDRAVVVGNRHGNCQKVGLGCKVTVNGNGSEQVFHLVGEWEADPAARKISYKSPLGQSLLGRKVGDKVEYQAPVGKIVYQITKID